MGKISGTLIGAYLGFKDMLGDYEGEDLPDIRNIDNVDMSSLPSAGANMKGGKKIIKG